MTDFEKELLAKSTKEVDKSLKDLVDTDTLYQKQAFHEADALYLTEAKPMRKIIKYLIPAVVLVAIFTFVIYFYAPSVANAFARATLEPAKYYQMIEKANLNKQIDTMSKGYGSNIKTYNEAINNGKGSELTLSATLDSSISTNLGLEDLENLKVSMLGMGTGLKLKYLISLFCNDKEITTFDCFADLEKEEIFLQVPELSKSTLKTSYSYLDEIVITDPNQITTKEIYEILNNNPLSEELLNKLLKKYSNIAIDELNNVIMDTNSEVSADSITSTYMKLTAKIDNETALFIAKKILNTAKSDSELLKLLIELKICSRDEYNDTINEALENITSEIESISTESDQDNTIIMSIWVDNKGIIIGRDISYNSEKESFSLGYKSAKDGMDMGVEGWFNTNGNEILSAKGHVTLNPKGVTGDVILSYTDPSTNTPEVFNISMKDIKLSYANDFTTLNGKFTITPENLSAIKVSINLIGKEDQQEMIVDIIQGSINLASVSILTKITPFRPFDLPSSNASTYDANSQFEDYIATADVEKYLENINEKIDVKAINEYLDDFLVNYSY